MSDKLMQRQSEMLGFSHMSEDEVWSEISRLKRGRRVPWLKMEQAIRAEIRKVYYDETRPYAEALARIDLIVAAGTLRGAEIYV